MRTPNFSALAVVLAISALGGLFGCKSKTATGSAILATVDVQTPLSPTCVVVEVSAGGTVRYTQEMVFDGSKRDFKVGIEQADLPASIDLRAYASTSAKGCDLPRLVVSASQKVTSKFPASGVGAASLTISAKPPTDLDADGDGHVAASAGGDDCNDGDGTIHPGQAQDCNSSKDTDCNGQAGCLDSACAGTGVCASGATALAFNTNPTSAQPGACGGPLTVGLRNAAAMPVSATTDVTVSFSAQPSLSFFSDSGCTTAVSSQTIAANASAATVYFKSTNLGSYAVTASAPALTSAMQTEVVSNQMATQLAFSSPARTVVAGKCSAALNLTTRDASGQAAPVLNAMQVALTSSQSGVTFYADAACATALPGNLLPFSAGSSGGTFYLEATQALATMVTASFTGLTPAGQPLTVQADVATHLAFVTQPQGLASAQCSGIVLLESRDGFENPAPPPNGQAIAMSETGVTGFSFFTDPGCTTPLSGGLPFSSGSAQAHYYFSGTTAGTATMTADAMPAFGAITQDAVIGVGAAAALVFTSGAQSAPPVTCSSQPVVVQVRDQTGNPVTVTGSAISVNLAASPMAGFSLYADAGCVTPLTGSMLSIPVGSSSASFWFKGTTVGPVVVTATSAPLLQDMQTESISAGPPAQLVFTNLPLSRPAGVCTQFDLAVQDTQANPTTVGADTTINLGSNPATVSFFSQPGCAMSSAVTSVTMTMGTGTVSFYASGSAVGTPQVSATAPFGSAQQPFTVTGGAPIALVVTTGVHSNVVSNTCSGAITLELHDAFNNVTTAPAQLDVALAATASVGFGFYLGGACMPPNTPITTASIGSGSSSVTVSFLGLKAESFNMTFTGGTLPQASQMGSIAAGAATQVTFTTPQHFGVAASTCSSVVTVERLDAAGNAAVGPPLSLTAAITGAAALFTDGNCTMSAGGMASFANGASTTDLYFLDATAESLTLTVGGSGLGPINQSESVTAGGPSQLAYLTLSQTADAGSCSQAVMVQRRDMSGNPASPATPTTVSLAWGGTGSMGFFSEGTCTAVLTGSTVDILANQSSAQFFFDSTKAETSTLTASAPLLNPVAQSQTIRAGDPSKLAFITAPQTIDALTCSASTVTVQSQDSFSNASNVGATVAVALSSTGSASPGGFSLTATSCAPAVTSAPIAAGSNTASFYFGAADAGTLTVHASATGFGAEITQDETIQAAAPKSLRITSSGSPAEAGACVAVTLTRLDQGGNPTAPSSPSTATLTAQPNTGLSYFSDSACTVAASTVTIVANTSSTTYYLKGITGGTGATGLTYSLGADAPGLTSGQLNFVVLQMVRRGTCTIANNANSATCAIAPAIPGNDFSRTFLVFQGSDIYAQPDRDNVECHLGAPAATGSIICTRQGNPGMAGNPAPVTLTWQTVSSAHDASVPGGLTVQHLNGSYTNGSTVNPLSVTIPTAVDNGQTFVLSSTSMSGQNNRADGFLTAELASNTSVRLTQGGGANKMTNNGTYSVEVVTFGSSSITRGNTNSTGTGNQYIGNGATTDLTRTALFFTARTDDANGTSDAICKRRFRGVITNTTTLTFTRGNGAGGGCTNDNLEQLYFEEVVFPTGTLVQPVAVTVNANTTTGSGSFASGVDESRTLLFMPGNGPGGASAGETAFGLSDSLGATTGTPSFVTTTSIDVTRPMSVVSSTVYEVFVAQFTP